MKLVKKQPVILRAKRWKNNSELIADVHRLGYITGTVLDPTYGKGNWWKEYCPPDLIKHDLHTHDGVDFLLLPENNQSVHTVAFDPPYVGVGGVQTSGIQKFIAAYGLVEKSKSSDAVTATIIGGIMEASRVLCKNGILLLKVMNYVSGGKYRTVAYDALEAARKMGFELVDEFYYMREPGPQPTRRGKARKPTKQQHSRANYSLLFVLRLTDIEIAEKIRSDYAASSAKGEPNVRKTKRKKPA